MKRFFVFTFTCGLLSTLSGSEAPALKFSDFHQQKPGVFHKITPADLPKPYATQSVDNGPHLVRRPDNVWPQALPGFAVQLYASSLQNPRLLRTAPNGDIFLAESDPGKILVLRGMDAAGKAQSTREFASGLAQPFGIAFYPPGPNPQWMYVANTDSVVRFAYTNGDLKARSKAEVIVPELPGGGRLRGGGHWTRDIVFSPDGNKMFVSVGSHSNVDDPDTHSVEFHRADILEFTPDGKNLRVYAWGIRNPVGIAVNPQTGQL
ncbi:MAG: PQQ-dependent sugar dehydrogenase, partial [Acidobacteriaceae bacterium]|nr:PQQ-dependent sugar dehydrogenase [Acidobacteriaceae bacterium]